MSSNLPWHPKMTSADWRGLIDSKGQMRALAYDDEALKLVRHSVNAYPHLVDAIRRAADMLPANAACGVLRAALELVDEK